MKFEHRAILMYFILGVLWILFTDIVASYSFPDNTALSHIQTLKGWLYVAITSFIFYQMLKKYLEELRDSRKTLYEQKSYLQSIVDSQSEELTSIKSARAYNPGHKEKSSYQKLTPEVMELLETLRENQTKLIKAGKTATLEVLTSGLAHEINNPLNFIRGSKLAIKSRLEELEIDDHEISRLMTFLDEGVNRASSIVDILRSIDEDEEETIYNQNLHEAIDDSISHFLASISDRIEIKRKYCSHKMEINASRKNLGRIFNAILENAIQSIAQKGFIHITTNYDSGTAKIMIKDSGIGIAPENLDKVSDPFFTTRDPGSGRGLGLFVVERTLEKLNGEMEIQSGNAGSTVIIKLPVESAMAVDIS